MYFRTDTTHEKYTAIYQHWCPKSEKYAGGDHLISAFRLGWELDNLTVFAEQDWKRGTRPITLFHFVLVRDKATMIMPVISNPYVERFISDNMITVVYDDVEPIATHRA